MNLLSRGQGGAGTGLAETGLGQLLVLTQAGWGCGTVGQEGDNWECPHSWEGQERRPSSCKENPSSWVLVPRHYSRPHTAVQTHHQPSPGPPMAPSHSLVEVLLGSDLFLSVFQKDGEGVIRCCLSCSETGRRLKAVLLPCPPLLASKRRHSLPSPGQLSGGGAKDRRQTLRLPHTAALPFRFSVKSLF